MHGVHGTDDVAARMWQCFNLPNNASLSVLYIFPILEHPGNCLNAKIHRRTFRFPFARDCRKDRQGEVNCDTSEGELFGEFRALHSQRAIVAGFAVFYDR